MSSSANGLPVTHTNSAHYLPKVSHVSAPSWKENGEISSNFLKLASLITPISASTLPSPYPEATHACSEILRQVVSIRYCAHLQTPGGQHAVLSTRSPPSRTTTPCLTKPAPTTSSVNNEREGKMRLAKFLLRKARNRNTQLSLVLSSDGVVLG